MAIDRCILASVLILLLVEVLCVVSLFSSDWIITDFAGTVRYGLYLVCQANPSEAEVCLFQPQHTAWTIASFVMVVAVGFIAVSISLLGVNLKRDITSFATVGKWVALLGLMLLCVVGIIFPLGFAITEFGGSPYLLTPSYQVGYGYVLFNIAIVLGVVALIVANRMFWTFFSNFFTANN